MSDIAEQILAGLPRSGWDAACISLLPDAYKNGSTNDPDIGLVDGNANAVTGLNRDTWGIDYWVCEKYCTLDKIPGRVSYEYFASSIAQYMLPWLALTAQLPFAAGTAGANSLSWCLALGSPALVTFSLVITILNRNHVRKTFTSLKNLARNPEDRQRLAAAERLLSDGQQVPLHVRDTQKFQALVELPQNLPWWQDLPSRLKKYHRGVTPAFIAQYGLAMLAWIFTISVAFVSTLDGNTSATQLSSSNLWAWTLPVVAEWLIVDTQYTHDGIDEVLTGGPLVYTIAQEKLEPDMNKGDTEPTVTDDARSIDDDGVETDDVPGSDDGANGVLKVATTSTVHKDAIAPPDCVTGPREVQHLAEVQQALAATASIAHENVDDSSDRTWGWKEFSVAGDLQQVGPVFNYARIFNQWTTLNAVTRSFKRALSTQENSNHDPVQADEDTGSHNDTFLAECPGYFLNYEALSQIPLHVWKNVFVATVAGLAVQWSTAGSSIVIAYFTVPKGLGCYSIYYILYAGCSTAVLAILLLSSLLSHTAMLKRQKHAVPSAGTTTIAITAVITRSIGQIFAVINACGLVAMSLAQLSGIVFSTCWCQALVASRGENAWVPLFRAPAELRDLSKNAWLGGLMMSVSVCIMIPVLFWLMVNLRQAR